jgi:flagellar hook-associated protein 2
VGFTIDGINSGLSTTEIIDSIMKLERQPAVLMENQQTEKTNIVSAYKALQAKIIALETQATRLALVKTYNAASITLSDDTVVNATATGRVGAGSYDLQVQSLARNHQIASQGFSDKSKALFGTGTISLSVGDGSARTITIDASNNSMVGIQKAINDADAGVTATIVNDGSKSNSYRLILTGDQTGVGNTIDITSSLTGGYNLEYENGSFDVPETRSFNSASTSTVSLGSTAGFSGNQNKIYTFTVAGTGKQTIGTDNITINWTDGTNSGSIVVTQADNEVELVGTGADGLKLSLSSGVLYSGDSFQVQSFAPLLQQASDAQITVGSSGGAGSPITITSSTNQFNDVISGLSLVLKKETNEGEAVSITTGVDVTAVETEVDAFITKYNAVMTFIDDQNSYNSDTAESGVLFGDRTLQIIQNSIRRSFGSKIEGIDSKYNQMAAVGIRTNTDGTLSVKDSSALQTALETDLDAVIRLFTNSGAANSTFIEFVSSTADTAEGESYNVDITQAATHGSYRGGGITDPATTPLTLTAANNKLKFSVDGILSNEIALSERAYNSSDELVRELQEKIDNDAKIGKRGLTAEWVSTGTGTGYIELTSSVYGSSSSVNIVTSIANSGLTALGLTSGKGVAGKDVAGTINGEAATGSGQILTGKDGNATTDGLKLKITATADQVDNDVEGTVTITKGVAARLSDLLDSYTATGDGLFDRRIRAYQNQIDNLEERIADFDERLAVRRETLKQEWAAMEEALGQLNSQGSYLTGQLASMNANWSFNNSNS